jgi:uncharacterized protein YneR
MKFEIFKKIFDEQNPHTNISIFVSAAAALFVYLTTDDVTLVVIIAVASFSLVKVLSKYFSKKIQASFEKKSLIKNFSVSEKETINVFVKQGAVFITMDDYSKGVFSEIDEISGKKEVKSGFNSLISRELIHIKKNNPSDFEECSGFELDEYVYKTFLEIL